MVEIPAHAIHHHHARITKPHGPERGVYHPILPHPHVRDEPHYRKEQVGDDVHHEASDKHFIAVVHFYGLRNEGVDQIIASRRVSNLL